MRPSAVLGRPWASRLDRTLAAGAERLRTRRAREATASSTYLTLRDARLGTAVSVRRNRHGLLTLAAELRQLPTSRLSRSTFS